MATPNTDSTKQTAQQALEVVLEAIRAAQSALSPLYLADNTIQVGVLADAYTRTAKLLQHVSG